MKFTISKKNRKDGLDVFILKGCLTIHNGAALQESFIKHISIQHKGMLVKVQEVEEIDVSFLQLMLAISKL